MNGDFFWIYMLRCSNGSYYTGYTVNLVKRYWQHRNGKGSAKYTSAFHPTGIACCWILRDTKGNALRIEHMVRKQSRSVKDRVVKNPHELRNLAGVHLGRDVEIEPFDPRQIEHEVNLHEKCPRSDPFNTGDKISGG